MRIRSSLLAGMAVVSLAFAAPAPSFAEPGGCLKYGAAGAVGGHLAGHHGVLGAIGGCATGMWVRHKYRKGLREDAQKWRNQQASQHAGAAVQSNGFGGTSAGVNGF